MLRELVALRRHGVTGRMYIRYRLFDDDRYTPEQKGEFTGFRFQEKAYKALNDPALIARSGVSTTWEGKVDKVLFDALMRVNEIPTPKIVAVYDVDAPTHADAETLSSPEEVQGFLLREGRDLFAKPARAHSGAGAVRVRRVVDGNAELGDGTTVELVELTRMITRWPRAVIQRVVTAHPAIVEVVGDNALPTVRMVVLRRPDASTLHRAVLRVPTGRRFVDNFGSGMDGNFVASVNVDTGVVERAYRGWGLEQTRQPIHPDTGAAVEGLELPDWKDADALTLKASRVLAGMPLQSWDIAIGADGPLVVEVNDKSGQDILQVAGPPGMLDASLTTFLRERGLKWP